MAAMGRRLSNVLTLLSFLLLLAVVVFWVRSYLPDHFFFRWVDGRLMVVTAPAGLDAQLLIRGYFGEEAADGDPRQFLQQTRGGQPPYAPLLPGAATPPPPAFKIHNVLGIEAASVYFFGNEPPRYRVVTIPAPYLALPLAVLPAAWLVRRLRQRRRAGAGRCANCGYDLRGSPGRCPECGSNAAAAAA